MITPLKRIEKTSNPRCFRQSYLVTFENGNSFVQGRFDTKRDAAKATKADCERWTKRNLNG